MRGFVALATAALLLATAAARAQSRVIETAHAPSPALGHDLAYSVYLPPGYDTQERRYPSLYLLHGKDGNHREWLHDGHLRDTLDRMIAAGTVGPMIVIMPDGGGDSWYVDSKALGGDGDYGTAIGVDLVAHVDKSYRTEATRRFRAIGGLSMGGFGALRLAFLTPFRFCAAASFSGALWAGMTEASAHGDKITRIFDGAFGRPFDLRRFVAENPLSMIATVAAANDAPAVFLTVGDHDRYKLYDDTFIAFKRMRDAGMDVSMRMTSGDHQWSTWAEELPAALRFFDRAFKRCA
ncbi:MAG TPA: alpha/beta hydrolase family protein [Stellaceae bacterium]|nr:alpha/beta hydrolase family protein [Stellaceae bacterium]